MTSTTARLSTWRSTKRWPGTGGPPTQPPFAPTPAGFPLLTNDPDDDKSTCDIVPEYDINPRPGDPDYCEDHMPVAEGLQIPVVLVPGF